MTNVYMYMDGQINLCSSVWYVKGQYYLILNVVSGSLRSGVYVCGCIDICAQCLCVDVLIFALKCVCVWMYRSVRSSVCVWMY